MRAAVSAEFCGWCSDKKGAHHGNDSTSCSLLHDIEPCAQHMGPYATQDETEKENGAQKVKKLGKNAQPKQYLHHT